MRTTKQILEDICAHPERDELRLEYAASCELKDPDHARYIRIEVARAKPTSPLDADRGSERVEARITHPFREHCYDVTLRRGFVEEITIDPYVFIDRGGDLLDKAPIQRVVFTPKPLPVDLEMPIGRETAPSPIPELMACPHLGRLYSVALEDSNYQMWFARPHDIECVLTSNYLGRLIDFKLPQYGHAPEWSDPEYCADVWQRAFARHEFRKMLSIHLPGDPGESVRWYDKVIKHDFYDMEEPVPMTPLGRLLEQQYGYLPALHLHNRWGEDDMFKPRPLELILDYLRRKLPKFSVGAPVTDEMYLLPPAKHHWTGNDW